MPKLSYLAYMLPQILKTRFKKILRIDSSSGVESVIPLKKIGSHFHSYYVPDRLLNKNSVCYCVGAGADISFDTELKVIYDAQVFIFDPAPEGIEHFNHLKELTAKGETLTVGKKAPFQYRINSKQLSEIRYIDIGLWDSETILKFYEPDIEGYISHSVELFKETGKFIEAPVDRLKNLMKKLHHTALDLLKIEIEGAEYKVIDTIVEDKPDIKVILVEFDEVYHAKDYRYLFRIKESTDKLRKAGYVLVHSTPQFKRTFVRRDVFEKLLNQ